MSDIVQRKQQFRAGFQAHAASAITGALTIDEIQTGGADLTVNCGTDKTMVLSESVWDDLRVPITATKGRGVSEPAFAQVLDDGGGSTGVYAYLFDKAADEELFFVAQFPHTRKTGSDIIPHVHWLPTDTGTGTVRWGMEYTWSDINDTMPATTIIYAEDAADGTADKHQLAPFSDIDGSGITGVSSMLIGRIFRDADHANDDYDADAALLEIDFHYEVDTMGSRQEIAK